MFWPSHCWIQEQLVVSLPNSCFGCKLAKFPDFFGLIGFPFTDTPLEENSLVWTGKIWRTGDHQSLPVNTFVYEYHESATIAAGLRFATKILFFFCGQSERRLGMGMLRVASQGLSYCKTLLAWTTLQVLPAP